MSDRQAELPGRAPPSISSQGANQGIFDAYNRQEFNGGWQS
jgi:hypothetical protein